MGLYEDVAAELTAAMRARESHRVRGLRVLRSALVATARRHGRESLDDEAVGRLLVQLRDEGLANLATFASSRRDDLADAEVAEIAVFEEFLARVGG